MTWATSHGQVPQIIVYTIEQAGDGWGIGCMGHTLQCGLQLGPAIKLARDTACAENVESGLETCVEMRAHGTPMRLAHYQQLDTVCRSVFA